MRNAVAIWLLRLTWIVQPLLVGPLLQDGTSTLPYAGRIIAQIVAWAVWAAVLLATFVPSSVSLTGGRLVAPMVLGVTIEIAFAADVAGWRVALGAAGNVLALLVWFSAETGLALAQGSAYGDEQRFPLKPPVPYLTPAVVSWTVLTALVLGGLTATVNELWLIGVPLLVLAILTAWFLCPRFHQLSRRWLVVVPVGVVVHDPVLLAENALFRLSEVAALHLAPRDTAAADLTGGTAGVVIEITLKETQTVVKTGGREKPNGIALHVLSVLVSPSRPGRALSAAAARRLPVG